MKKRTQGKTGVTCPRDLSPHPLVKTAPPQPDPPGRKPRLLRSRYKFRRNLPLQMPPPAPSPDPPPGGSGAGAERRWGQRMEAATKLVPRAKQNCQWQWSSPCENEAFSLRCEKCLFQDLRDWNIFFTVQCEFEGVSPVIGATERSTLWHHLLWTC